MFPPKTITCDCNHEIVVTAEKLGTDPCHSYAFTAEVEGTTYIHTMTVGPVDGALIQPTAEQLQKDVDAARQAAADHAHARHLIKELESQIK